MSAKLSARDGCAAAEEPDIGSVTSARGVAAHASMRERSEMRARVFARRICGGNRAVPRVYMCLPEGSFWTEERFVNVAAGKDESRLCRDSRNSGGPFRVQWIFDVTKSSGARDEFVIPGISLYRVVWKLV